MCGLSLTTTYSAWITLRREDGLAAHVGHPLSNPRIYMLDGDGQPLPTGVAGELFIGGVVLAHGSFNRSELRAEHFPPDPFAFEPGTRMHRTVDLARWLRHRILESTGRVDVQVKIRGLRHELGEI
jgi:non-ribosomal peptide synthetase component F